ncbi:MAG TPA: hypothetical protein VF278_22205 [Pirellulales bacterium]
MNDDSAELKLLSRLHYALGALTSLCALAAIPFIWGGSLAIEQVSAGALDQELAGLVLLTMGVSIAVLCLVHAAVLVYIGLLIRSCRRWLLVVVFSGFHAMNVPFGTALSVYTLIVLFRDSVKGKFAAGKSGP